MSLQDATEGSDSLKSKSKERSSLLTLFSFEHNGSLRDRVLTASYMVVGALLLSFAAVKAPYGGVLCVAIIFGLVAMAVFEVVRLFAREPDTLHYRPVAGTLMYLILFAPACVAAGSALSSVMQGEIWWRPLYLVQLISVVALLLALCIEGRSQIAGSSRFAERYLAAFLIVGVCAPALVLLSGLPRGLGVYVLWWIAGCAALNDISAYFVGRAFGVHRMAPALSPQKTVEGSVAGLVVGTLSGVLLWSVCIGHAESMWVRGVISLAVVIVAQASDLAKSYLKRIRGVKDMGAIFPGHGGVLDRFDAMIGAAPVVVVALCLLGIV